MLNITIFSVITGVRFVMKKDTLFLQIKVGRLLALGNVKDAYWQPLPIEYLIDRVEINYVRREMEMVDLRLGVGFVLTGFYSFQHAWIVILVE